MSTPIEQFYPDLRADVPGCPEPTLRRELINALGEFCSRSWCWWSWLDDFELDRGEVEYTVVPPPDSAIVGIVSIDYPGGGAFSGYRFRPPYLRLDREPTQSQLLNICLALKPVQSAIAVEDFFFTDWREPICAGAKWRLLTIPSKPWTNLNTATVHNQLFNQGIVDATRRRNNNYTGRSLHVAFRRFA